MKKRSPEEVLHAIEEARLDDELARIARMSDADVSAEIRERGGDPEAIGARFAAVAQGLAAAQRREAWQREAAQRIEKARGVLGAARGPRRGEPRVSRALLLARIETARQDPRLEGPVAMAFRKKSADESTDEELESMLSSLEDLAKLGDALK